jgi:hypothetical protein
MSKIPWYVLFSGLSLLCIAIAVYFYLLPDPRTDPSPECAYGCGIAKDRAPWQNGPDCLSVKETTFDSSIPTPTQIPYLTQFKFVDDSPPQWPFCNPAWYAFRYVRNKDGAYGPLSGWTGTDSSNPTATPMAIYSCATELPCFPNGKTDSCGKIGITPGPATTSFNTPVIALGSPITNIDVLKSYSIDGYSLNIHRQVGYLDGDGKVKDFDPKSEGEIVGMFFPLTKSKQGLYTEEFGDRIFWPKANKTNSTTCGC